MYLLLLFFALCHGQKCYFYATSYQNSLYATIGDEAFTSTSNNSLVNFKLENNWVLANEADTSAIALLGIFSASYLISSTGKAYRTNLNLPDLNSVNYLISTPPMYKVNINGRILIKHVPCASGLIESVQCLPQMTDNCIPAPICVVTSKTVLYNNNLYAVSNFTNSDGNVEPGKAGNVLLPSNWVLAAPFSPSTNFNYLAETNSWQTQNIVTSDGSIYFTKQSDPVLLPGTYRGCCVLNERVNTDTPIGLPIYYLDDSVPSNTLILIQHVPCEGGLSPELSLCANGAVTNCPETTTLTTSTMTTTTKTTTTISTSTRTPFSTFPTKKPIKHVKTWPVLGGVFGGLGVALIGLCLWLTLRHE